MTELFAQLPFNIDLYDPFYEIIMFIENHRYLRQDERLLVLINRYLGFYLRSQYKDIYIGTSQFNEYTNDISFIVDEKGNTLLHHFASFGYPDLVELLLKKYKINPNVLNYGIDFYENNDDPGKTAIMCVVEMQWTYENTQKFIDICVLLVKYGADWIMIFRSLFWRFDYYISDRIRDHNRYDYEQYDYIEENIIRVLDKLKKINLINLNVKCVSYVSQKFGRREDPEGLGRRKYYHLIYNHNKYCVNDKKIKEILYLAIITKYERLVYWLIRNNAEMEKYIEYEKMPKDYIDPIKKEYTYQKRKSFLEVMEVFYGIRYLSTPYHVREILTYL